MPKLRDIAGAGLKQWRRSVPSWRPPTCPYCGGNAVLRDTRIIYGRSYGRLAWVCEHYPVCDAYVGASNQGNRPLGTLANAELRGWRGQAHAAFDRLWRASDAPMTKAQAYEWMARALDIAPGLAHIGMLDIQMCQRLIKAAEVYNADS